MPSRLKMNFIAQSLFAATRVSLAVSLACVAVCPTSAATLSGATGSHDPSRMILCNGRYYVYSTGGGMKSSSDGIAWTAGPSPFASGTPEAPQPGARPPRGVLPASLRAVLPESQGIWAPDVIFYNKMFYLYYSACGPHGVDRCGIGLLTSPTLDPSAANYKWTDAGVVLVTENLVEKKAAIDPGPFVDAKGDLWLVWGSGYANGNSPSDPTIIVSKLDNATGLRSKTDTTMYPVAPGHIEAAYVHYRAGFYYAFWNDGGCCNGTNSSYRIHVARAVRPQGPYVNKAGKEGAGDIFFASIRDKQLYGPGHMGIESEPGIDRFSFHYYNADGRPVLGVRTLVWGADGWPSVGSDLSAGTYTIKSDDGRVLGLAGAVGVSGPVNGTTIEPQPATATDLQSQRWRVALTAEGYYRLTSAGSDRVFEVAAPSPGAKKPSAQTEPAPAGAGADPLWIIDLASDGKAYRLTSSITHEALTLSAAGAGKRGKPGGLATASWSNLPGQRWSFVEAGSP